jgi:hypothetical protein
VAYIRWGNTDAEGTPLLERTLVVAAALVSAVFIAIGIVVRQRATMDVPEDQGVSTVMLMTLLRRPLWWAGTGAAVTGYAFQAVALAFGSLTLVAPLLVSALLFALPLSARLAGRSVTRVEWVWALVLTVALAVFVALARTAPGDYEGSEGPAVIVAAVALVAAVCTLPLAIRLSGWRRALLLATAVGVLFGVLAVLTHGGCLLARSGTRARRLVLVASSAFHRRSAAAPCRPPRSRWPPSW